MFHRTFFEAINILRIKILDINNYNPEIYDDADGTNVIHSQHRERIRILKKHTLLT